jgi:hypothetical protein
VKKYYATYYRHYCHQVETCDSLEEATRFLINGEDYGELSSVCIWSEDGRRHDVIGDEGLNWGSKESEKYPTFEEVLKQVEV